MKKASVFILIFTLAFAVACKGEKEKTSIPIVFEIENTEAQTETSATIEKQISIILESKSESNVTGTVVFTQQGDLVTMVAEISGLTQGLHAIHLHEKADCSSDDGLSTGGHWNPTGQPHGKWGDAEGFHKGDIGNIEANTEGIGTITFSTNQWCIGCEDETKNILGKAIIVHEGIDDFTTQPTGDAGSRVSCGGVIE